MDIDFLEQGPMAYKALQGPTPRSGQVSDLPAAFMSTDSGHQDRLELVGQMFSPGSRGATKSSFFLDGPQVLPHCGHEGLLHRSATESGEECDR